jgi:hypothetical protein
VSPVAAARVVRRSLVPKEPGPRFWGPLARPVSSSPLCRQSDGLRPGPQTPGGRPPASPASIPRYAGSEKRMSALRLGRRKIVEITLNPDLGRTGSAPSRRTGKRGAERPDQHVPVAAGLPAQHAGFRICEWLLAGADPCEPARRWARGRWTDSPLRSRETESGFLSP